MELTACPRCSSPLSPGQATCPVCGIPLSLDGPSQPPSQAGAPGSVATPGPGQAGSPYLAPSGGGVLGSIGAARPASTLQPLVRVEVGPNVLPEPQNVVAPVASQAQFGGPAAQARNPQAVLAQSALPRVAAAQPAMPQPAMPQPAMPQPAMPQPAAAQPTVAQPAVSGPKAYLDLFMAWLSEVSTKPANELASICLVGLGGTLAFVSFFLPWANSIGMGVGTMDANPRPGAWAFDTPAGWPIFFITVLMLGAVIGSQKAQEVMPNLAATIRRLTWVVVPMTLGSGLLGVALMYLTLPYGSGGGLVALALGACLLIAGSIVGLFFPPVEQSAEQSVEPKA